MEQEQYEEWLLLRKEAEKKLRGNPYVTSSKVECLFQMLVLPSFEDAICWEVYGSRRTEDEFHALRRIWRAGEDAGKLQTPVVRLRYPRPLQPTVEEERMVLEPEWVTSSIARLSQLSIPILVESPLGLDGTSFELSWDRGFVKAHYGWWSISPEDWKPLTDWFDRVLNELESTFALTKKKV